MNIPTNNRAFFNIREIIKGFLDFYLGRIDGNTYGGPFNNQKIRQEIFNEIIGKISFIEIIETGTFNGNTTEYMHKTSSLHTSTVEIDARRCGFARARLFKYRGIKVYFGHSSNMLKILSINKTLKNNPVFFYLDAHRHGALPLLEELEMIFMNFEQALVMIDDFRVPHFPGYRYDKYKTGEHLEMEYLKPLITKGLQCFSC
nr:hypothetical protein [Bacteroidota bacterium]